MVSGKCGGYGALSDRPRKSYITLIYITVFPLKYVCHLINLGSLCARILCRDSLKVVTPSKYS